MVEHPNWDLQNKPLTTALLDRSKNDASEAIGDLRKMMGKVPSPSYTNELSEAVEQAIGSVAYGVATRAMEYQNIPLHLPSDIWRKEQVLGAVYGFQITTCLWGHIKNEDIEIGLGNCLTNFLSNLTLFHSDEEHGEIYSLAFPAYKKLLNADGESVLDWKENLDKSARIFLIKWQTKDSKLAALDTDKLLGELLGSLLKSLAQREVLLDCRKLLP